MTKVGLVMRKIQFTEAQGPRIYAERLKAIAADEGIEIVFVQPERLVSGYDQAPGFEYEKGDLVNYDIVLDQLYRENIDHVICTVSGFTFLKLFIDKCVLFPHSYPHPALTGADMMRPFYSIVDKAIVHTEYLKRRFAEDFGVTDVDVIPIGFEEELARRHYDPSAVVKNRVLWIGRDEPNRRPEIPIAYAKAHPDAEVVMVFGGLRYKESMKKYDIPPNVKLMFALGRDDIFRLMNSAKVYWSTSVFDTFAMPLAEAMAMGKLIVKPDHPCYGHISGRHAFAGNPDNWFELVNMALAAPAAVSEDNRERAFERFSERVMREGYRKFFAEWIG
ncbi:glycosyltransferase [Thermobacillus composti KWC4]|uniref:Glycosyltransferase n=1 Tax=Thermobacillus composti (strain DSM 18247 / JCM 13945 / KWC4) TaxID=717605 RepID=L0ECT6_THECK|nr:glycosyltransferase [Thermobacillus composti]AGA57612.1 glycosyltransferase [Thermobacillus composti KWC4]